jgi:hypothetical protein
LPPGFKVFHNGILFNGCGRIRFSAVVAVSLYEKRRREDARLAALVKQIAREQGADPELDRPHRIRVADGAALRGVPAIGRDSNASAIAGTVPGTGPLFDDDDE